MSTSFYDSLPYWKDQTIPDDTNEFTDPLFPPDKNSLLGISQDGEYIDKQFGEINSKKINTEKIIWKRVNEIFNEKKYCLYDGKLEISEEQQGSLQNNYLIAALKTLIPHQKYLYNTFKTKKIDNKNYFEVVLFIEGKFQIVIVDDFLPVSIENNELIFSQTKNNEIWISILEKAWAKINGGYANILNRYISEILLAITGIPCNNLVHNSVRENYLWIFLNNELKKNVIISCRTKLNVSDVGLMHWQSYLLINVCEINSSGFKIKLIQLQNPWYNSKFNGHWSNYSILWGNEEKSQVDFDNKDPRNFYICFDDFIKYFSSTDIFYFSENKIYSKSYEINCVDVLYGQIFNIYLEGSANFTLSLIKKNNIFNYQYKISPSYLAIAKYDPLNDNLNNYFTDYDAKNDSHNDVTMTKFLEKGHYIIYSYLDIEHSTISDIQNYIVKFDCDKKFKHCYKGKDSKENGLNFLKKLIIQCIFDIKKDFDPDKNYYSFTSQFMKDGLGHRLVNNQSDDWLFYEENTSTIKNMFLLSPYEKNDQNNFNWYIPPKSSNIILGMCLDTNYPCFFNLKGKFSKISKTPEDFQNYDVYIKNFVSDISNENYDLDNYYDYISIDNEKAIELLAFEQVNLEKDNKNYIEGKYPNIMKIINENFILNEENLFWVEVYYSNLIYVGQVNENKNKEGVGAIIIQEKDFVIISEFKEGNLNGKGFIYNKNIDKKIFEGEFKNGQKCGKGILEFSNGDKYDGLFENDKFCGKGIYYFNDNKKWEGNFTTGVMDGDGIFTLPDGNVKNIKFANGVVVN